jgi:type I restriction enzyme S subunit
MDIKFKQTEIEKILENWDIIEYGDIAKLNKNVFKPSKETSENYLGLEHLNQGGFSINSIGKSDDLNSIKFKFESNNILFGKLRPYFKKVYKPNFSGICSTDIWVINSKDDSKFNQTFLYYLTASDEFVQKTIESSEGTRMPRASWNFISKQKFTIPKIEEQKNIASFFSTLDDKIELNQKTIKTLEEIGQTLFKKWFIDFEFPNEKSEPYKSNGGEMVDNELGEIPKGWTKGILGDIAKINTKSVKPFNFQEDIFIHYSIPSFDDTHAPKLENGSEIKSNKTLVSENSLLVSKLNPLGWTRIWTVFYKKGVKQITSTEFINYIPKNEIYWSYLNFLFREKVYYLNFCSKTTGSTGSRQRVLPKSTLNTSIAIPTVEVLNNYSRIMNPVLEQIEVIHNQIQELKNIRDSLLPKLLNGKIRI